MKISFLLVLLLVLAFASFGQPSAKVVSKPDTAAADKAARELASVVLKAHGGDKLKQLKSLTLSGSVDVNAFGQAVPATFAMVFSGEKYRIDLNNPFQPIKQIYDGTQTLTNGQGAFKLPPLDRTGFYVLGRIGDAAYPINALPATAKGKSGFRITAPDGNYTDFYIDTKTSQVKGYESAFEFNGMPGTTSVEIDKYRDLEGVFVPEKFAQRFDLGQITAYCSFKAKEIAINTTISSDVFTLAK